MKKMFMLFILIPIGLWGQFREGTIIFNDGSTKKGYVNSPDQPNNSNVRFKTEENGAIEKFSIDNVKGFEIIGDQNEIVHYTTICLAYTNPFHLDKIVVNKRKNWARIVKEGKVTLYALDKLNYNIMLSRTSYYCIKKQDQDYALYLGDYMYGSEGNWNFNLNNFKLFKETIQRYFEKECPQLADLMDKEDFKKNGMGRIVELYDQNCE
ncbi:MAG: hypothetical protein KA133_03065 [Flavobacterium sp.]|nr:hypothetical protein [Flavobacterium sp.]